jgi:DNA-binding MarR family transcriptional regulator
MSRRPGGSRGNGAAPRRGAPGRPWSGEARRLLELLQALGGTTFRQLVWQRANELDLTFAQSQVLAHVAQHPGCHMSDLAKAFRVTLPAATHIVDRLEQKGFVGRGPDPDDRRVCVLELTPAGDGLVRELEALQLGGLDRVLARVPDPDRACAVRGLEALVKAAAEVAGREEVSEVALSDEPRNGAGRDA